jgi:tetratricopeptide (TPR) repeat protein
MEKSNMDKLQSAINQFKTWWQETRFDKGAKNANVFLLLAWRASIAFLVIWAIWRFTNIAESDTFVLKSFSVTPDMEKMGYRGEVVVAKIMSEMLNIIYPKDSSTSRISACRQNDKVRLKTKLRIADGQNASGYDIEAIFEAGKTLLGKEDKVISGYVVNANKEWTIWIQMPDEPLKPVSVPDSLPFDTLLHRAALFLVRQTTPQYLANYLIQKKQFSEADVLLAELDFKQRNLPTATEVDGIQTLSNWANYFLAKNQYDRAYAKAEELHQHYPNDIASYALRVSVLMSKAAYLEYYEAETSREQIRELAEKAFAIAQEAERKEKRLKSVYFEKNQAMGLMLSNAAYLANQCQLHEPKLLEKYLQKSRKILPQSVYIYNNLAYFYLTQGNRDSAERYIQDALDANRLDGNIWDTYAEIMLKFRDTTQFFNCFEKALQNQKIVDGITVEEYRKDARWNGILKSANRTRFRDLLNRYDIQAQSLLSKIK